MNQTKKCDIAIAYRIYPKVSKVPPVYSDNKYLLSKLCLESFKQALGNLNYKLFVILDNCPPKYEKLFTDNFRLDDLKLIKLPFTGNSGTFDKQIDILLNQEYSENIYFAEDDYFYLPDALEKMINFMKSSQDVHFITPYNHPDYENILFHNYPKKLINFNTIDWQLISTTTMTFMTTKKVLLKNEKMLRTYQVNNYDASLWSSITKINIFDFINYLRNIKEDKGFLRIYIKMWWYGWTQHLFGVKQNLFCPIPTLSTHMDSKFMADGYDWDKLFKEYYN